MKQIKKCPFVCLLAGTGLLFTIIALTGRNSIYAEQEYEPAKAPVLSVMFTALGDEIYPWQLFMPEGKEEVLEAANLQEGAAEDAPLEKAQEVADTLGFSNEKEQENSLTASASSKEAFKLEGLLPMPEEMAEAMSQTPVKSPEPEQTPEPTAVPTPTPTPEPTPTPFERMEPLRETTHEEYLNHVSADIYGDAGVVRAAGYEFVTVGEEYFDDALFIGDSRIVGLRDYTTLKEHGDFYCETALTIHKVLKQEFKGKGTVQEALAKRDYGKIYMMVGINELGTGTTEDFIQKYAEVVDELALLEPDAKIFIMGIMKVTEKKSTQDGIFNNENIEARNHAIATLADNERIFYVDVNEAVCDENGNLKEEYSNDQIHLLGMYNDLCKQFLMEHGAE